MIRWPIAHLCVASVHIGFDANEDTHYLDETCSRSDMNWALLLHHTIRIGSMVDQVRRSRLQDAALDSNGSHRLRCRCVRVVVVFRFGGDQHIPFGLVAFIWANQVLQIAQGQTQCAGGGLHMKWELANFVRDSQLQCISISSMIKRPKYAISLSKTR